VADHKTTLHETMYVTGPSREDVMEICKEAREAEDAIDFEIQFRTFVWDAQGEHWRRQAVIQKRTWESVVLDKGIADHLKADITAFCSQENRSWYKKHFVPYRRGYLFYGPPGTGKTSTISTLASLLERDVHRINLVARGMTDDSFHAAINSVRENSMLVMEDIDCLFDHMRDKKEDFAVTFSGLLNSIDGLQDNRRGLIFVFTSNHRDKNFLHL
jgi:mitochondrial chaperone BCS1